MSRKKEKKKETLTKERKETIVFVVMGAADAIDWPVAVYFDEELAQLHVRMADRIALKLSLIWGYKYKEIPKGSNPWDPLMYSEDGPIRYYYAEVPIGQLQFETPELGVVGDEGHMPKEGDVGVPLQTTEQRRVPADAVREGGASGSGDIVSVKELGCCAGNVFVTLETDDADSTGEGSSSGREATVHSGEVARDN